MQKGKAYELLGVREQQMCVSKELGKSVLPGSLDKVLNAAPKHHEPRWGLEALARSQWGNIRCRAGVCPSPWEGDPWV